MARWPRRRPAEVAAMPTPLALPTEPVADDPEALRAYWRPVALAMLQETTVPTRTILDAYLGHLGLA